MESSPDVPAVTKHPQLAALKHLEDVNWQAGMIPAWWAPPNSLGISPPKGALQTWAGHSRQTVAKLRDTL